MPGQEHDTSSFHADNQPWRVRFCRRLWSILRFVRLVLITDVIGSTIANLNTTTTDTPLSKLNIIHLLLAFPIQVVCSLGVLILLTLLSWIGSHEPDATIPRALSEQERVHMLRRLRLRYEQMLAQSLQGAIQVEMGLVSRPTAVQNAMSLSLRLPDQLELAHYLVQQAEQNVAQPLPILLPLSSWATKGGSLQNWLIEQFALLYEVHPNLSRQWIQAKQFLPMLDGLDEMEASARTACITAINTYHREHLQPLVVCSRTDEYDTAARQEHLAIHAAVVVQPLSQEQVDTHLANMGQPLAALRAALAKNPILQMLATTPLMLQILMLAYHDISVQELSQKDAQLREQIWTDYVRRMVDRKGNAERYPLHVTQTWLGWLAREMRQHNLTIFSLKELGTDWLPQRQGIFYRRSIGPIAGLPFGLYSGVAIGLYSGMVTGVVAGLICGSIIGLLIWLYFGLFYALLAADLRWPITNCRVKFSSRRIFSTRRIYSTLLALALASLSLAGSVFPRGCYCSHSAPASRGWLQFHPSFVTGLFCGSRPDGTFHHIIRRPCVSRPDSLFLGLTAWPLLSGRVCYLAFDAVFCCLLGTMLVQLGKQKSCAAWSRDLCFAMEELFPLRTSV